jgi:hypothetical protein
MTNMDDNAKVAWIINSYPQGDSLMIHTHNIPELQFEEVQVFCEPGRNFWVVGAMHPQPLRVVEDDIPSLQAFVARNNYGGFGMVTDDYIARYHIELAYLAQAGDHIVYRHATLTEN